MPQNMISAWAQMSPEMRQANLQEMQMKDIESQKMAIEQQRNMAQALAAQEPQQDLRPIASLVDAWTGSQFARKVKAPQNNAGLISQLQGQAGAQQRGVNQSQIALLRSFGQGGGPSADNLTIGQKEADKKFAKDFQSYSVQGGYSAVETSLGQLEDVLKDLEANPSLTGPDQFRPMWYRRVNNPDSVSAQQRIEQIVQQDLRATIGSQFTEREADLLFQRSYDPVLPADINVKKLRHLINKIKTKNDAMRGSSEYFQTHGTIKGFSSREKPGQITEKTGGKEAGVIEWLHANPDHPRADAVRARYNKMKGAGEI